MIYEHHFWGDVKWQAERMREHEVGEGKGEVQKGVGVILVGESQVGEGRGEIVEWVLEFVLFEVTVAYVEEGEREGEVIDRVVEFFRFEGEVGKRGREVVNGVVVN